MLSNKPKLNEDFSEAILPCIYFLMWLSGPDLIPIIVELLDVLFLVEILITPPIASEPWIEDSGPEAISILEIRLVSKL